MTRPTQAQLWPGDKHHTKQQQQQQQTTTHIQQTTQTTNNNKTYAGEALLGKGEIGSVEGNVSVGPHQPTKERNEEEDLLADPLEQNRTVALKNEGVKVRSMGVHTHRCPSPWTEIDRKRGNRGKGGGGGKGERISQASREDFVCRIDGPRTTTQRSSHSALHGGVTYSSSASSAPSVTTWTPTTTQKPWQNHLTA